MLVVGVRVIVVGCDVGNWILSLMRCWLCVMSNCNCVLFVVSRLGILLSCCSC